MDLFSNFLAGRLVVFLGFFSSYWSSKVSLLDDESSVFREFPYFFAPRFELLQAGVEVRPNLLGLGFGESDDLPDSVLRAYLGVLDGRESTLSSRDRALLYDGRGLELEGRELPDGEEYDLAPLGLELLDLDTEFLFESLRTGRLVIM